MKSLILLYWGTIFLIYLSQVYDPVDHRRLRGRKSYRYRRLDVFMIAVIMWLACFSFLRVSYNDTITYIKIFHDAPSVAELVSNFRLKQLADDPLSQLYQSFVHDYTGNYHIYFLVPAVLNAFAVIRLFKRYSVNPAMSLLIFFSIGTYVLYMAALKQSFAVFFLLMSIPCAEKKQYGRFYLLVIIAALFHTYAFMFGIVPFLFGKPWNRLTWILLAVTLFAMVTYRYTFSAFINLAQSLGLSVSKEEVFDGHRINVLRVAVYWAPGVLALVFHRRLFRHSSGIENLFVNMSIVSAMIMSIGLAEGANLYARMAGYFEIAAAVAVPWMIQKLFNRQSARVLTVCAGALYFGYFLFEFAVSKNFGSSYQAISLWDFILSLFD